MLIFFWGQTVLSRTRIFGWKRWTYVLLKMRTMVQQWVLWTASKATNMHLKITMYLSNKKFELKFSNYNITRKLFSFFPEKIHFACKVCVKKFNCPIKVYMHIYCMGNIENDFEMHLLVCIRCIKVYLKLNACFGLSGAT